MKGQHAEARPAALPVRSYGLDVARFEREHPDVTLSAGESGCGYTARRRGGRGGGARKPVHAPTLDALDAELKR